MNILLTALAPRLATHAAQASPEVVDAPQRAGGEAGLVLPDLSAAQAAGVDGRAVLLGGLLVCAAGIVIAAAGLRRVARVPVHRSMREVSELIYDTCKTYLITQCKLLAGLELLVGAVVVLYFAVLRDMDAVSVGAVLVASALGILGSVGIAWFGIRVNTFASSRAAFASLRGSPFPTYEIPMRAGMSIGMLLISVELILMLSILLFVPRALAGPCFIGFAIGESLGASALRVAGGIFTKIADIGSDLMKIVFRLEEDDPRNAGVIADCVGDNAGDSVGPTADGFETYGVTATALVTFILLAVPDAVVRAELLVWVFATGVGSVGASVLSYALSGAVAKARWGSSTHMDFEAPLTQLAWLTSIVSIAFAFGTARLLVADVGDGTLWWKLASALACGTFAGALIPEVVKVFTSTRSEHVREVVQASREGGASLNVLAGLTAGSFSALWIGAAILVVMAGALGVSTLGLGEIMTAPAVFAFGLAAFGFLGMGPVTIAVDSYGPVTDNAQSVYELSMIETTPGVRQQIIRDFGFDPDFERGKHFLEENDGAGNTFKATAKPVLIGTAVVGATTMLFSIVLLLTDGLTANVERLSILHPPFLLGLISGGAVIHWFTGASIQAVVTGAYRAVEFIRSNLRLDTVGPASAEASRQVVEICTRYAQRGMLNIFLAVFFMTLAMACLEPFLFIGYLVSIASFGLYQALFMANAGGAWDNAKKVVEVEMRERGTELHAAVVVGDTVGDPFKDTSSVALNPVIKFSTLFGLLAVEVALELSRWLNAVLGVTFLAAGLYFVWRSFYSMRIRGARSSAAPLEVVATEGA